MDHELAAANVNRTYSLAATSIAIFTFSMIFLYPRYVSGDINPVPFQVTLVVMAVATFSYVFATFFYYGASIGQRLDEAERASYARRGDRLWLLGMTLLFLIPSLVLLTVNLLLVSAVWFLLWVGYVVFAARSFPRVLTAKQD